MPGLHKRKLRYMTPLQIVSEAIRRGYKVHFPFGDTTDYVSVTILGDPFDPWLVDANEWITLALIEETRCIVLSNGREISVKKQSGGYR